MKKNNFSKIKNTATPFSSGEGLDERAVRAKKHLGQHFLKSEEIAEKIANTLGFGDYRNVLEIGPGMGVLTKYLIKKDIEVIAMDLDTESIAYLQENYPDKNLKIIEADFLC